MSRTSKTPFADKLMKTAYVGGKVPGLKGLANKTNAIRAGTQIGVGTGIDQGVRALINNAAGKEITPLMFSDTALYGKGGADTATVSGSSGDVDLGGGAGSDTLNPNVVHMSTFQVQQAPVQSNTVSMDNFTIQVSPELAEQERQASINEGKDKMIFAATAAGLLGIGAAGVAWKQARKSAAPLSGVSNLNQAPNPNIITESLAAIKAQPSVKGDTRVFTPGAKGLARATLDRIKGNVADRQEHILNALRRSGTEENDAQQLVGQMGAADDVKAMMDVWIKSGKMIGARVAAVPMRDLRRQYLRWNAPRQQQFQ